jgi:hypothetical protein
VLILDSLLIGGIRFVLDKVVQAVEAELGDDAALREELLAAQMRVELGEIEPDEFAALEADLLARIREVRERQLGEAERAAEEAGEGARYTVAGVEATLGHDDER